METVSLLPVDEIKVDANLLTRRFGERLRLEAFFAIAEMRQLRVIVERVETSAQAHLLRERGCDLAQGYFFGAPAPTRDFDRKNAVEHIRRMLKSMQREAREDVRRVEPDGEPVTRRRRAGS